MTDKEIRQAEERELAVRESMNKLFMEISERNEMNNIIKETASEIKEKHHIRDFINCLIAHQGIIGQDALYFTETVYGKEETRKAFKERELKKPKEQTYNEVDLTNY